MPNVFGAQLYDIGEPFAKSDGNKRVLNTTICDKCQHQSVRAALNTHGRQMLRCCWKGTNWTASNCTDPAGGMSRGRPNQLQPCTDVFNCSLPEPETGKYGPTCLNWSEADLLPSLQHLAKWMKLNSPSGIPGNQFMGSIHPRIKRPVGRRLAHAAAHMLHARAKTRTGTTNDQLVVAGAATGPTIAGCRYPVANGNLELRFNASLLGGESLLLRETFDANETGGWSANPYNDTGAQYHPYSVPHFDPSFDALGAMVCVAGEIDSASSSGVGNVSTCQCQSWDWTLHNSSNGTAVTVWFCETGMADMWRPPDKHYTSNRGHAWHNHRATRYLPTPNPYHKQWAPAPLKRSSFPAAITVDLSVPRLKGKTPLAVRYAWPLFDGFHGATADTCCPTRAIQDGHGPCLPGSCPLYSAKSELPANPFFAVVDGERCRCKEPQVCGD